MRRSALLALPLLLLSACDDYTAPSLYQATTPDCKTWTEGSRFELPRGITVYATPPTTLTEGGTELALIFTLPVGTQASFTRLSFLLDTWNEMRVGMLALIRPVITSTLGRCVARMR